MWIVRLALNRPYTFIVLALLILLASPVVIMRTPTDIFPNINIPVVAVAWQFTGLNPEEMEGRFTTGFERILTTTVDNIEHIESTTINGQAIIKIFLQPNASLDTANAQITAVSQVALRQLPAGAQPPLILNFSASSVPIIQLALSGEGLSEQQLNDIGLNFLRTQLVTVPGASIPYPYGGKQTQVMIDLNPRLLQSKGLSATDVVNAVNLQNLVLPSGTAKIGEFEYDVDLNGAPRTVEELNDIPIKVVGNSTIYLRDVAHVRNGFAPQTNVVRHDGLRGVLVTVLKAGSASTLDVVNGIRDLLPRVTATLPPELKIQPLADQSIFVRAAVSGVIREAVIAACLTGLMILIFLASWRSTVIIAVSIPLSILTSIIVLSFLGETINIMTLGGLALAVGMLVDDATVEIENTNRNLDQGKETKQAILDGASQIAVPALVSTLCICIVFLPMFFLSGVARYLFVPLAEAVVFAMLASYFLSRTLVPTLALYLLKAKDHHALLLRAIHSSGFRIPSSADLNVFALATSACSRRWFIGGSCLSRSFFCSVFPPGPSCPGSVKTFFPTPTAASLSSMCAPRPARALKKPRGLPISSKTRSAGSFRPRNWTTFSTTSVCLTAPLITCTARPASLARRTRTSWCPSKRIIGPRLTMSGSCAKSCRVNFPGPPSISYPRISSRKF